MYKTGSGTNTQNNSTCEVDVHCTMYIVHCTQYIVPPVHYTGGTTSLIQHYSCSSVERGSLGYGGTGCLVTKVEFNRNRNRHHRNHRPQSPHSHLLLHHRNR